MKRILSIILFACICLPLWACGNTAAETSADITNGSAEEETTANEEDIIIAKDKRAYYTIVAPSNGLEYTAAFNLYKAFRSEYKIEFDFDSDGRTTKPYEILIGRTGREESKNALKDIKANEYIIRVVDEKVVILGKNTELTVLAVDYFLNNLVDANTGNCIIADSFNQIFDGNLTGIVWEKDNINAAPSGGYARMCTLPDGSLMIAYESGGIVKVIKSTNGGKTWSSPVNVTKGEKTPSGEKMTATNANPFVTENGDILVSYRAHTSGENYKSFYSSIRVNISRDNGATWELFDIVAENTHAGTEFTGFWEPHIVYIKDGKLAIYYASDCIGGSAVNYPFVSSMKYQHIIMHIYDEEAKKFGNPIIASNGENHKSRDGMPVVSVLSDGSYVMVIEANNESGYVFTIKMLFSEDGITWSSPKLVAKSPETGYYCGAPYVALLPDGRIAVSYQGDYNSGTTNGESSTRNSVMRVIISKDAVSYKDRDAISEKSFDMVFPNPILYVNYSCSVWPALYVANGKLYCMAQVIVNGTVGNLGIYLRSAILNDKK